MVWVSTVVAKECDKEEWEELLRHCLYAVSLTTLDVPFMDWFISWAEVPADSATQVSLSAPT
jgi:hypothetical protein